MMTPKREYETSEATRKQLIETAEAMFLAEGLETVSSRAILRKAGQRNLSALKYHFGSRDGLLAAITERRASQIETKRQKILADVLARTPEMTIRDVCAVFVTTPVSLCREDPTFRAFLAEFGQRLLSTPGSLLIIEPITSSVETLTEIVAKNSRGLDPRILLRRIEDANALGVLALSRRAKSGSAFRGKNAELFTENLIDELEGLLTAPVSKSTSALLRTET